MSYAGLPQGDNKINQSKQRYVNCHHQRIHETGALPAADISFCLCPLSPEEPSKLSMFNMVCRWPWGLFGSPIGRHILSISLSRQGVCLCPQYKWDGRRKLTSYIFVVFISISLAVLPHLGSFCRLLEGPHQCRNAPFSSKMHRFGNHTIDMRILHFARLGISLSKITFVLPCSDGSLHVTCTEPTSNKSQDVTVEGS